MKNIAQIFILLVCLYSCHPENQKNTETVNNSTIVLITKGAPESKDYSFKSIPAKVRNFGEIQYVDTAINLTYHRLQPKEYDTIIIYSVYDNLEIKHDYTAFESVYYLLNRGDTVLITYEGKNIPHAKILNRPYNDYELNYDYLFLQHILQLDTISYLEDYFLSPFKLIPTINATENLQYNLKKQISYLDSLHNSRLISEEHFTYRKNNILSFLFLNKLDSVSSNSLFISDSLYLKNDSLIYRNYYRNLLTRHIQDFIKPPFDLYNRPNTGKIIFDSIIYSPNYSKIIKRFVFQYLANNEMDNLRNNTSNDDLQKMLTDYVTITGDSVTYDKLKKQFGLLRADSLEITLINTLGNITSLNNVFEKHKGKYVYVDFWATWCMPCRALLPDNAELEKEYHDKNIVFVSLAYNDDEKKWKELISDSTHLFGKENYFITNTKSSRIIEEWRIKTIPRYMLFDENGGIAILDAPRPNTKQIREVLNKLLASGEKSVF
jgi:thiol-disulfide isomerase/thioredoxin